MSDNTVTPQSEAFIIVKSLFLNFLNDSRAKEFVPLIVHHCHKDEIISGQAYIEPFESFLKQKGLNVINIQKILSNEIKAGHITAEELFLKGNGHYTWLANQIIGYKIMPFLLALKDQHKRVKDYLKFKSLKQDSLVIDFDFSVLLPDYKSIFFRCGLDKLLKEDFQSARAYLSRALKYFNSSNRSNTLNTKISDTNLSDTNLSGINHKIDYNTACLIDEFAKKAGINIKDFFYETDYYEESKISVMNMIKKAFPWIEKNQIKDKIKDTNNIKNKNQIKDTNNIKDKRKENNNNLITTLYDLFIKEQALLNKAQTSGPFNNSIKTKTALVQAKRAFFLLTAPDNDLVRPWHALELASRAASALNYTDPKVNLVMSMAYFKLNRFDESSETARAALAVLDKNKHNDSQLIKALEFLINTKKALNWSEDIFSESLFNQAYTQAFSGE
jgi:tetratricopeptide (TPR) repeat protein